MERPIVLNSFRVLSPRPMKAGMGPAFDESQHWPGDSHGIRVTWRHGSAAAALAETSPGSGGAVAPEQVRRRILARLGAFTPPQIAITGRHRVVYDLSLDSAEVEELIGALEDDFGIDMPLACAAAIVTVDDLVAAVVALTRIPSM